MSADPTLELETTLQLVIPADPQLLRIVRLVASGVASLAGADLDTVEEVRVGADELVAALMEAGTGGSVSIDLELDGSLLRIRAATDLADASGLTVDPLSDRILEAVSTRHGWATEDRRAFGTIERQLR